MVVRSGFQGREDGGGSGGSGEDVVGIKTGMISPKNYYFLEIINIIGGRGSSLFRSGG